MERTERQRKRELTPDTLFDWAVTVSRKKADGQHVAFVHPTYREAARHFGVSLDAIAEAIEDWGGEREGRGYMATAVGFQSGNGSAAFERRGQYLIEAFIPGEFDR